ncbi:MAG: hypothetical protein AB7E28_06480, partial [Desulfurella sp.]
MFDPTKSTKDNVEIFFTKESIALEETIKKALNIDCLIKFTKAQTTDKIEKKDFFGRFNIDINGTELGLYVSM